MNERIKELWEQAVHDGRIDTSVIDVFAELIVRKCADRATWAQDTGEKDIGGEVLKHFGVEK
jgi:hypothetical protein